MTTIFFEYKSRLFFKICNAAAYILKRLVCHFFHRNKGCQNLQYRQTLQQRSVCVVYVYTDTSKHETMAGGWVGLYLLNNVSQTAVHGMQTMLVC